VSSLFVQEIGYSTQNESCLWQHTQSYEEGNVG